MFGLGNYMGMGPTSDCYPYYASNSMCNNNYSAPSIVRPETPDNFTKPGERKTSRLEEQSKTAKVIGYGTLAIIAAALVLKGKIAMSKMVKK